MNASPEDAKHILASKALANYYNMPCRGLGTVTDSFCLDYQTGIESSFLSVIASLSGVDIIFHSCGIVGSMLYMSYEKFIADVELWRMINSFETPMEWSQDALAIDLIKKVGQEGNYLVEEHTLNRCRDEFFIPELGVRMEYSQWQEWDKKEIKERAKHLLNVKLSSYKKPYIEKSIAKQLIGYVHGRKNDQ